MNIEIILVLVNTAGVVLIGFGMLVTWKKNGTDQRDRDEVIARGQQRRDQILQGNQENIIKRLDDPSMGLQAIHTKANEFRQHCAEFSTKLMGRVDTAERDIREIKAKK